MVKETNASDLVMEFNTNEAEANEKYAGKEVKVTGELFFVGESGSGKPMILFRSPEGTRLVLGVYFNGSWGKEKDLLIEGTPAIVEGTLKVKEFGDIIQIDGKQISNFVFTIQMK